MKPCLPKVTSFSSLVLPLKGTSFWARGALTLSIIGRKRARCARHRRGTTMEPRGARTRAALLLESGAGRGARDIWSGEGARRLQERGGEPGEAHSSNKFRLSCLDFGLSDWVPAWLAIHQRPRPPFPQLRLGGKI